MGRYSAGFTLDTYGHLMEALPKRQVEWIDEIVFPEGFVAALNLPLDAALSSASACSLVQQGERLEPSADAALGSFMQSGAAQCMAEGGRFELPIPLRV
jgi:hypothetical protein